jgi:hypothetical protein
MSTGIASWSNPAEITAIYPFPGTEWLLVIAGFVFWIWWHVKQIREEDRALREAAEYHRRNGLRGTMEENVARSVSDGPASSHSGSSGVNPVEE